MDHTSSTVEAGLEADQSKWDYLNKGFDYKGEWTNSFRYKVNDVVLFGATLYIAVTHHTSVATNPDSQLGTLQADIVNWEKFVPGLEFENTWQPDERYQPGDFVTYGGYSYVATSIHTNKIPSDYLAADWDVVTTGFDTVGTYNTTTAYKAGDVVQFGGYAYVAEGNSTNVHPTTTTDWNLIVPGIRWAGTYATSTVYELGDAVSRNSNSYISVASTNTGNDPATDSLGTYWNALTQGAETNVLITGGDILIQGGAGAARLPVGAGGSVLAVFWCRISRVAVK